MGYLKMELNTNSFKNIKTSYNEQTKELFKRNKWTSKEIYLREHALNDKTRILIAWNKFKHTFKDNPELISLTEQFLFSHVFNRSGLLEKGEILKEILINTGDLI